MLTNRRNWLRQIGLATAGLGATQFRTLAEPAVNILTPEPADESPIRLSSNENPYGPSPLARAAMAESIHNSNRYNWNTTKDLISAIAQKNSVAAENILVGPGSTEILDLVIQSLAVQKGSFVVANPTYSSWIKTAEKAGLRKISFPLMDKRHELAGMLAATEADTKMIYVCNPNNPTGTICDAETLVSFIKEATKTVKVLIDEAYLDFTDQRSASHLVTDNKNLIVVKTFSKIYGLVGARIGYAIAHTDTIKQLNELQSWANGGVSVVSRSAAMASLKDDDFVRQCLSKNEAAKKYTIEELTKLNITCIASHTNFIYFSLSNYGKDYFALLKTNNIQGTNIYEEEGKWTRITVGTMEEMKKFIRAVS